MVTSKMIKLLMQLQEEILKLEKENRELKELVKNKENQD